MPGSEAHNVRVAKKHETIIAKIVADMPKHATWMEIREMRKAMDQLAKLSREAPRMKKALSLVTAKVATNTIISAPLQHQLEHLLNYDDPEVPLSDSV